MKASYLGRAVPFLTLIPMALIGQTAMAQVAPDRLVPLRNWTTPLHWQPNLAEHATQMQRKAAAGSAPRIFLSQNQATPDALTFVALSPCRLVDTRGASAGFVGMTPFNGPAIPSQGTVTFPVLSDAQTSTTAPTPCGFISPIAEAYSLNVTIVPKSGGPVGYITIWPSGTPQPSVATITDSQGFIAYNAAIVAASTDGSGGISVFNSGPAATDIVIDMNGFFTAPTDQSSNTAVGFFALVDGGGSNNTAVGTVALAGDESGSNNTAVGNNALTNNDGSDNTATGNNALENNTTGKQNTAAGSGALAANTTGNYSTATGFDTLTANTTGSFNTATGYEALAANTTGGSNTATGILALSNNTTGGTNTATGDDTLTANTTGSNNTATGGAALNKNTTGSGNTSTGTQSLAKSTTADHNTANGFAALQNSTTGASNTAVGYDALQTNSTGSNNIAVGATAGQNVVNSNNIEIGNAGASGDSGVINIGTAGKQTSTFIAGITGVGVSGVGVVVSSSGQLGITTSSRRFKEQITEMGDASSKLYQLRPVNFYYKPEYDDGSHLLQYGLIAEEVEKVFPEMVAYDNDGKILTVKYQMLAPMLLNEAQKQHAQLQSQKEENQKLEQQNRQQAAENRSLEERLTALEAVLGGRTSAAQESGGGQ